MNDQFSATAEAIADQATSPMRSAGGKRYSSGESLETNEPAAGFTAQLNTNFDFCSSEFVDLFARSEAGPFQHPLWLDRLYAQLVNRSGATPAVVTVRSSWSRALVAVLPLVRRRRFGFRVIEFADLGVSDYVTPICDRSVREALLTDQAVQLQIHEVLKPYDLLKICKIRDDAPLLAKMLMAGDQLRTAGRAHAVPLFAPFDHWRTVTLQSEFSRFLKKKRSKLRQRGRLQFELASDPESIRAAFSIMKRFRRARFEKRGWPDVLQEQAYWDFYLDIAIQGVAVGLARTHVLRLEQHPIGVMFGLAHREKYLFLLMGFDYEQLRNHSVGLLLLEDVAADCIMRGNTLFDLTIGDEAYKYQFGTTPTALSEIMAGDSIAGSIAANALGIRWTRRLAKRVLRA